MSQATQGQHLRLQFGAAAGSKSFAAYSTDLTFHVSNTLENSTTKDTTDASAPWIEQEKTKHNIDGSIVAIMDEGEAQNFTGAAQGGEQVWELDWVSGEQNRVVSTKICSGDKMLLSNVEISAPRDGFCQITGNFVIFGAISFS
ncbi:MAG: hypothetical protein ACSW8D_00425 [Prevotella sp.]